MNGEIGDGGAAGFTGCDNNGDGAAGICGNEGDLGDGAAGRCGNEGVLFRGKSLSNLLSYFVLTATVMGRSKSNRGSSAFGVCWEKWLGGSGDGGE